MSFQDGCMQVNTITEKENVPLLIKFRNKTIVMIDNHNFV